MWHENSRFLTIFQGRPAWNLATSDNAAEAQNIGHDVPAGHYDQYWRAPEFHPRVTGRWDSYEDEAFVREKAIGTYYRPEKYTSSTTSANISGSLNMARDNR